jgi:hypothetical protein
MPSVAPVCAGARSPNAVLSYAFGEAIHGAREVSAGQFGSAQIFFCPLLATSHAGVVRVDWQGVFK